MDFTHFEPYIRSRLISLLGTQLPFQGILAGPGMAALLLSILWDRDIQIDSIDLYTDWTDEPLENQEQCLASKPSLNDDIYPPILNNGISFISTESKGILKRHIIEKQQSVFGKERTLLVLYALELNAFGVGYDCYSQKLHFTSEFEEFCSTRQLRIQSPVHAESLFLLLKFRNIYGCFADIDEEMRLLNGFRSSCAHHGTVIMYNDDISPEGKRIFNQVSQELEPFCSIVDETDQPVFPSLEESLGVTYRISFNNDQENSRYHLEVSRLMKSAEMEFDAYFFAVYYKYCVRSSTSNSLRRRFMLALSRPMTACMVMLNPACLEHDFTDIDYAEQHEKMMCDTLR